MLTFAIVDSVTLNLASIVENDMTVGSTTYYPAGSGDPTSFETDGYGRYSDSTLVTPASYDTSWSRGGLTCSHGRITYGPGNDGIYTNVYCVVTGNEEQANEASKSDTTNTGSGIANSASLYGASAPNLQLCDLPDTYTVTGSGFIATLADSVFEVVDGSGTTWEFDPLSQTSTTLTLDPSNY